MAVIFKVEAVVPKNFLAPLRTRGAILRQTQLTGTELYRSLQQITATWKHHSVTFSPPVIRYAGGDAYVGIFTDSDIFYYLNNGTRERWAVLSPNWVSKTSYKTWKSGAGRGIVIAKGKKQMTALGYSVRPGIAGRKWVELAIEVYGELLYQRVTKAISTGNRRPSEEVGL